MTLLRRSLIAGLSFVVASIVACLLGGDPKFSGVVGLFIAVPVFIAAGLRESSKSEPGQEKLPESLD